MLRFLRFPLLLFPVVSSFVGIDQHPHRRPCAPALLQMTTARKETGSRPPAVANEQDDTVSSLLAAAANATALRGADNSAQAHDSFRYEWGTWVNEASLQHLMETMNTVRLRKHALQKLYNTTSTDNNASNSTTGNNNANRLRVASGTDWDVLLHVLPQGTQWSGRWPTGSWACLVCLSGMAKLGALPRGTVRQLRGASDGSLASGGGGGSGSAPEEAIKYVGGPLRAYTGAYGKTVLLEVVLKPPIGKRQDAEAGEVIDPLPTGTLDETFELVATPTETANDDDAATTTTPAAVLGTATALEALNSKTGLSFDAVGGLDDQLTAIARRVLASRANPAAAKRLGVSHVRGILLSGPPGCGKTLLARELSRILGAREPQIVNGPEILDKFIGEAEKKVRELFVPAELEWAAAGDDSALHIIILDEMDAIARKRGSTTSDTTGVRDSVVNQLLAKMDGVKEAANVLVVGLTNRPELLDPALLRPGRLEVQLRVELPDLPGRRDILRIHTRTMRNKGGVSAGAVAWIEDLSDTGLAASTDHFTGAELAGLVRSAASFALTRTLAHESDDDDDDNEEFGMVSVADLQQALGEVLPALGKQDEVLKTRFPLGISPFSSSMERVMRDLSRFTSPPPTPTTTPRLSSLLVVGAGGGGAGATALAAWAASQASTRGSADYVRFITALDLLSGGDGAGEEARAAALVEQFSEAKEMPNSLLVLDDVDQLCAGSGPSGYSSVILATLRALLRSPPSTASTAKAGGQSESKLSPGTGRTMHIIAATSRSDAACVVLHDLFDETIVVPLLQGVDDVQTLLDDSLPHSVKNSNAMAALMIDRLGEVGCKSALRLAERAVARASGMPKAKQESAQQNALDLILEDLAGDEVTAERLCEVL